MNQQHSPDQQKQVKKAKFILWLGLVVIIFIGLAIAVYFMFLKTETVDTNNENKNTNTELSKLCTDWQPTPAGEKVCARDVGPGYYYDIKEGECQYYSGGSECGETPFTSLSECEKLCEDNTSSNTNTAVNTSSWQTHENEKYGYSFKYPEEYDVRDLTKANLSMYENFIGIGPPHAESELIFSVMILYDTSIDEAVTEIQASENITSDRISDVYVAGVNAKKLVKPIGRYEAGKTIYVFSRNNKLYQIVIPIPHPTASEVPNVFSTFQLSEVTTIDTTNWQTHEDRVNGYSVQYPSDYLIKLETDGHVIFDPESIDSPDTSYLHFSVTVEDTDVHTYRLGILTNQAVDNDSPITEGEFTINGLSGTKIVLKNALGETILHYVVSYLGKVYDLSANDSIDKDVLSGVLARFKINQLADNIDIADTNTFTGKSCVSNNDCGAFPCLDSVCLVKECTSDSDCSKGTCGQYVTPVPGYCTTIDVL